jgi:hypothetical protein
MPWKIQRARLGPRHGRQFGGCQRNSAPTRGKATISRACVDRDRGKVICPAIAILLFATGCLIPRGAVAYEAETAPSCTGCRQSSSERAKPASSGKRTRPAEAAVHNDGAWEGVSSGPCIMTWNWTIDVSNGRLTGDQTTGTVSRGGAVRGTMVVFSSRYRFVGHMNGRRASGTWRTTECSGNWTASRH